jgi:hypothetical protein
MRKGSFLNQKLGKRMSRKSALLKSRLSSRPAQRLSSFDPRHAPNHVWREEKPK